MNEIENMARIDKLLKPEVDENIKAMEKSYEKYGNIFRANEFLTPDNEPLQLSRHWDRLKWYQKIVIRVKLFLKMDK
jgi:hypothetical protein